jgi:DNA-binding NtrC family response regulator
MEIQQPVVLIADDEDGIRELLKIALCQSGFQVLEAEDGEAAIKMIRSSNIDVVISDVLMPQLSGIQVLEIMRSEGIQTPFVLISGCASDIVATAQRLGVFDFIQKPFDFGIISNIVSAAVRSKIAQA